MNIIIAGCGNIGNTIVSSLCSEGHNVVIIDNYQAVITNITNTSSIEEEINAINEGTDLTNLLEDEINN